MFITAMYLNYLLLYILYLPLIYFYLKYIRIIGKPNILFRARKSLNKLLLFVFLGILLSMIVGSFAGKFPSETAWIDLMRIINHLLVFIMPIVLIRNRSVRKTAFKQLFNAILLLFVLLVGYSLLSQGIGESAFYGNFFGATTINLTLVSMIAFYGLFDYYVRKNNLALFIAVLSWIISLASLAKWNFWVDITFPILLFKVWFSDKRINLTKRLALSFFVVGLFVVVIYPNLKEYLDMFALLNDYSSFESYMYGRVLESVSGSSDNVLSIGAGSLFFSGDMGISDGARFSMWGDLLQRTFKQPLLGLGLGTRAFDYMGGKVEDHSVLVYFISRFGFILGSLVIYYTIRTIKSFYSFCKTQHLPLLKFIYLGLVGNFFFQGLVGMIWGQLPVTFLFGLISSMFFIEVFKLNERYG